MFAMITATSDEVISSTSAESSCSECNPLHMLSINNIYKKVNSHRNDTMLIKNLLVNLQNKLTMMDNRIEISFESIKTKIS
jgi:hypothetical protein